jgi:sRNA-binding regulator protein Hfq
MKESVESTNRKLIRPSLTEVRETLVQKRSQPPQPQPQQTKQVQQSSPIPQNQQPRPKRFVPSDQTNAENFYYVKQMQNHTPMVLVLQDGETLHGKIEWYDRGCLKLSRDKAPNLLVYKHCIKYIYKDSDKGSKPGASPNGGAGANGSAAS